MLGLDALCWHAVMTSTLYQDILEQPHHFKPSWCPFRKRMKLWTVLSYKSDMEIIICRYGFCLYCYLKIIDHG